MCWDSDVNYVRLSDFAEALEEIGPGDRIESDHPSFSEEGAWDGCFVGLEHPVAWTGVYITKRRINTAGSQDGSSSTATKEFDN
jgi:hypothetical protein